MSAKMGNRSHKEGCQKYKQSGRREINKAIRAKRNEKRIEKFAARKAAKEARVWDGVPKDPETRGSNREPSYDGFAYRPGMDKMLPYQKLQSLMRRVQNQLDAERAEQKKKENNKEGKKN